LYKQLVEKILLLSCSIIVELSKKIGTQEMFIFVADISSKFNMKVMPRVIISITPQFIGRGELGVPISGLRSRKPAFLRLPS